MMNYKKNLTVKEKLGIIIKNNRKKLKLSQKDLAKKLIYNQSVVSRLEKGYEEIQLDIYYRSLNFFNLKYDVNSELESKINDLINNIYNSYFYLIEPHFNDYLEKVNEYTIINNNIIKEYDLKMLKVICVYMLRKYREASILIEELDEMYFLCEYKCIYFYEIIKTQLILRNSNKLEISNSISKLPLETDSEDGLIIYLWGKFYFKSFNYTKAIENLLKAIHIFQKDNNFKRIVRCELMIIEILLKDSQYIFVKNHALKLLENKEFIHGNDLNKLYFFLGYSHYYLNEYKECLDIFENLKHKINFYEHNFILHIINKCLYKMNISNDVDINYINSFNVLNILYFKYQINNIKDEEYYSLIEDYLLKELVNNFFKKEYQYYIINLLDHYYNSKKYSNYKQLSDLIHKIMHI